MLSILWESFGMEVHSELNLWKSPFGLCWIMRRGLVDSMPQFIEAKSNAIQLNVDCIWYVCRLRQRLAATHKRSNWMFECFHFWP